MTIDATDIFDRISTALAQARAICAVAGVTDRIDQMAELPPDALLNAMWAARDLIKQAEDDADALLKLATKEASERAS